MWTQCDPGAGRGARRRLAGGACDCSRPVSHPAPKQHGVVSRVCPHSRIAAVSLAEFVAVHLVLVKLPVAILTHPQFRVKYYYSQSSFRTPPVPSVFEDSPVYQPGIARFLAVQSYVPESYFISMVASHNFK